jgi:hypothetical protein
MRWTLPAPLRGVAAGVSVLTLTAVVLLLRLQGATPLVALLSVIGVVAFVVATGPSSLLRAARYNDQDGRLTSLNVALSDVWNRYATIVLIGGLAGGGIGSLGTIVINQGDSPSPALLLVGFLE